MSVPLPPHGVFIVHLSPPPMPDTEEEAIRMLEGEFLHALDTPTMRAALERRRAEYANHLEQLDRP